VADGGPKGRKSSAPKPALKRTSVRKRGVLGTLVYWSAVLALWGAIIGGGLLLWLARDLPTPDALAASADRPSIAYLDVTGAVLDVRGAPDAPPVQLDKLPPYVPAAFIAIEDRKFYRHWGFDIEGLLRAAYENARAGRVVQGGSTITQQLAKNVFLSSEQSMRRKAQELMLAVWLESKYTKDEILALYLARVYFGAGAWGLEEASKRYFGKEASALTIPEAAMLAGLLKAPSRLSPLSDSERAARRADVVLATMVETGVISAADRERAQAQPLRVLRTQPGGSAGYFVDWVAADVGALIGEPAEDIIVETTLDLAQQTAGERALIAGLDAAAARRRASQGALVALAGDGAVRVMVGGKSYEDSQYNRVTQARRQPGSAFKPFVYLAAVEAGYGPWSTRIDQQITIGDWTPQNYDGRYRGEMPLITALSKSVNTIAVQLAEETGRDAVIRAARRLGVTSPLAPNRSLALGADVVSPLELTAAYAPFANGGAAAMPYGVLRIRTRDGRILYERAPSAGARVIDDRALRLMNFMMRQVVVDGTGTAARVDGRAIAGKTGTTSDYRDAWFVGYTGGYVASVWVGADDNARMASVSGGQIPARIWRSFMAAAVGRIPPASPLMPAADDPDAFPAAAQTAALDPAAAAGEAQGFDAAAGQPPAAADGAPQQGPSPQTLEQLFENAAPPPPPPPERQGAAG
jgi:penicillin-binding protein 1A